VRASSERPTPVVATRESFALGADGTRLYVRERGESRGGLTTILCDGICCDGYIWKYLWDDLAPLSRLCHWNYRGHGRSAPPRDPHRIDISDHADDLDRVRSHVGDDPVVLVGHSMGCQVVLEAFRRRPANVRGIVLVCGSSGRVTHTFHGTDLLARALPGLIQFTESHRGLMRGIWSRIPLETALKVALRTGEVDKNNLRPEDFMPYLEHVAHMDLLLFLRMLRAAGEYTAEEFLTTIDVPTLVVAGKADTFTPFGLAEKLCGALPRGELFSVPGGTHVAPLEQRELVGGCLIRFLRERIEAVS
jgi:pimeloyl-ACP methyl ester carboxylesterase